MIVSVVIPVYNVKPYLERCVQSVLRQTYKDLEVILVDDGSTDGSGVLCDQIASLDPRIRVIHQENQGLSGARNTGIRQSGGDYITFLDSDDEWLLSDGLEKIMQGNKADLIAFKRVDIYGNNRHSNVADYDLEKIEQMQDSQLVFSYLVTTQQLQISACFQLVRKHILLDYEIYFPCNMISEDVFWNMCLWQHLTSVRFTNFDLYGYHHREGSITTKVNIRVYHSYDKIFTYFNAQCDGGCKNADMIRAYMANMWVSRGYDYLHLANVDKPRALKILRKHSDLLNYGISPKSKRAKMLLKFLGLKSAIIILGIYWRIRSWIKH